MGCTKHFKNHMYKFAQGHIRNVKSKSASFISGFTELFCPNNIFDVSW
jgi:hypothetical protein